MSSHHLIPLLLAALPLAASAQIVINEIAAATSERLVRYDQEGAPHLGPDPQWHHPTFDTSKWYTASLPIGTGTQNQTRTSSESVTLYARTSFNVTAEQAASTLPLALNVSYDDGFIAYLNGKEVARSNLGPKHAFAYHDQTAYNPNSSPSFLSVINNAASHLVPGENTLAIQVHSSSPQGNAVTRLSATLEFPDATSDTSLVPATANWKLFGGSNEPSAGLYDRTTSTFIAGTNWKGTGFDDSVWPVGNLPIGFDATPHYTLGSNLLETVRNRSTSIFFRAAFSLTQNEIDSITSLSMEIDFDDGFAISLNGNTLASSNLNKVEHSATASYKHDARYDNGGNNQFAPIKISPQTSALKTGLNVVAVQVHNIHINDDDMFAAVTLKAHGLGRDLIKDDSPVSYFIGTSEPTEIPTGENQPTQPEAGRAKISDWIELHNTSSAPVDLAGWSLTDSPGNLDKWVFPKTAIEPGGYLVVLASGKNTTSPFGRLQTNFKLSAAGEFLALVKPDGTIASQMGNRFPKQSYFHTYGRDAAGNLGYFPESTPGRPNPTSSLNSLLTQPEADLPTGFYPGHVTVTLSKNNPLGTVRYTTDGSDPTETNGIDYTAPINTSGVRDQAENEGDPGGVLREIWTAVPGTSVSQIPTDTTPDFIFNTTALSTPPDWTDNYGDRFRGFLRPPVTGDYSFWIASGDSSELWLSPTNNSAEKQLVASVPNRTNSRQWDKFPSQHSIPIRLETGKSYYFESLRKAGTGIDHLAVSWDGPGIDRTVIFGDVIAPVILPNTTTNSKSMTIKARTFAPGHVPSTVTTRSYLINHDPRFAENHALLISGDPSRSLFEPNGATAIVGGSNSGTWNPTNPTTDYNMAMEEGRAYERPVFFEYIEPGGSLGFSNGGAVRIAGSPHARPRYNFSDLENNNWLGSWTTKPSLNFFFRDELGNATVNYPLFGADRVSTFTDFRLRAGKNDSANPFIRDEVLRRLSGATGQPASRGIFLNLFINGHFKAYFNLTERLRERFFQEHHNSSDGWDIWHIREIVEGDRKHYDSTMNLLRTGNFNNATTYAEAASRVDLTSYIDYIIVNAYGATGDWPHNNYNIARERSETGKWHFNVWDAEGAFGGFGHGINWNTFSGDLLNGSRQSDPHMTRLVYKALRTNPEFRLLFADRIQKHFFNDGGLTQESIRDIYLATRDEFAPVLRLVRNQAINESFFNNWWPSRRRILFSHFESQALWPDILPPNFSKLPGEYPVGTRIFMADINSTGTVHFTTDGSDPRATGGAVTGQTYDGTPVTLTNSLLIKARSRLANGSWSPLREILFTTPQPPALVISEIHYNPEGTDSLEFVELKNIGTAPIGLDGLTFSAGIKFTFSSGTVQPGGLLVIVKDPDAFTTAHPEIPIAGTFTGSLDNAGERLTLSEPGGRTVFSVGYNDKGEWPSSADGDGFSLVLSNPADPDSPSSWRSGAFVGGTPGSEPFSTFAEWQAVSLPPGQPSGPLDDPDGDLIPNFIEYTLALSPLDPDPSPLTPAAKGVKFTTYAPASDVTVTLLSSPDLVTWLPVGPGEVTPDGDGTQTHNISTQNSGALHFRLRVTLDP